MDGAPAVTCTASEVEPPFDDPVNQALNECRNTAAMRISTPTTAADTIRVRRCSRVFVRDSGAAAGAGNGAEAGEMESSFERVIVHPQGCGLSVDLAQRGAHSARARWARCRAARRAHRF